MKEKVYQLYTLKFFLLYAHFRGVSTKGQRFEGFHTFFVVSFNKLYFIFFINKLSLYQVNKNGTFTNKREKLDFGNPTTFSEFLHA